MRHKKSITTVCLLILIFLYLFLINETLDGPINGQTKFYSCLVVSSVFFAPLGLALLLGAFKKSLFHWTLWIFVSLFLIIASGIFFEDLEYPVKNQSMIDNKIVEQYFYRRAPFFTPFTSIITYNQSLDSASSNKNTIIKCMYRLGEKVDRQNVFIAKVQLQNNKVIKEFYNQPIVNDTILAKKEFAKTLKYSYQALSIYKKIGQ